MAGEKPSVPSRVDHGRTPAFPTVIVHAGMPCAINTIPGRSCHLDASPLRNDGLCFGHGKDFDGTGGFTLSASSSKATPMTPPKSGPNKAPSGKRRGAPPGPRAASLTAERK
jgi:hypothetical protein